MNPPKYINWFVEEGAVTLEDGAPISCYRLDYSVDDAVYREWALHLRQHYETDDELKESIAITGLPVEEYLRTHVIPQKSDAFGPTSRSNDFTEIMISDLLEFIQGYTVPRCKQRNRSGKTQSEHDTDILAYKYAKSPKAPNSKDELLAVEVKAGFPDVSLLEPLAKALDISISELVLGRKLNAEVDNIMSDDEIMKEAILILKREIAKQIRKKIIMTSIAVIFPFFISIFFWSYIPDEIAILIGTNSPYASKAFAFTIPPIVLLIANAIHVAAIDGKIYNPKMPHGTTFVFPLIDAPTNTLSGKLYMLFKQAIYWIVPVLSFIGAIMTYAAAFRK